MTRSFGPKQHELPVMNQFFCFDPEGGWGRSGQSIRVRLVIHSLSSDQIVEINKAAQQRSADENEKHKPTSRCSSYSGIERVGWIKDCMKHGLGHPQVRPVARVSPQDAVNPFAGHSLSHRLMYRIANNG